MATADELFDDVITEDGEYGEADNPVGTRPVAREPHIIIGSDRKITVPDILKIIAVQYDHNIETVTFDCPRYWDGRDLSVMKVYINYMRADGKPGSYPADNITIDDTNESTMHFDWTITRNVTEVKGDVSFLVCIKNTDSEGNEINHWNSQLNRDLTVLEGLECSPTILENYPDIITQILTRLDSNSGGSVDILSEIDPAEQHTNEQVYGALALDEIFISLDEILQSKQEELIDGETIKTINGQSLLGSGNIIIDGGSGNITIEGVADGSLTSKKLSTELKHWIRSGVVNVKDYDAVGDGVTDDTSAIQRAVSDVSDNTLLIFPKGHYIVKPTSNNQSLIKLIGLKNITIDLNGSTIEVAANNYSHYNLLELVDCENFDITNGILKGDKSTHDYTTIASTHEFGYGVFARSSSSVSENGVPSDTLKCCGRIHNCEIFDFIGDGIITKNGMSPGKIEIVNCEIHHCRRQGITILDSDDIVIDGCHIHHIGTSDYIGGASPKSGIDVEPATGTSNVNSVYVKNTIIEETSNDSIIAVTKFDFDMLDDGKQKITKVYTTIQNITIENCRTGVLTIKCHQNKDVDDLQYATINIRNCVLNHSICEVEYRPFCVHNGTYTNCDINTLMGYNYSDKDLFITVSKLINCTLNISPKVKLRYIELYDSIVNGGTVNINENSTATIRDCHSTIFTNCLLDATDSSGIYKFVKCSFINCDSYPGSRTVQFYNCYLDKRYIEGGNYVNCIIANENANEISENASDAQSPSAKAVYYYGQTILTTIQGDLDSLSALVGGAE